MRWLVLALCIFSVSTAQSESFYVTSPDGVPLAVTAQGPAGAPEVLMIHGTGHGRESFSFQFESPELADFRLVAFDMRGHGQSGKPWTEDGYNTPAIWAGDVNAVMEATALTRPVMIGWSYSGFVVMDYIRVYGTERVGGIVMANSLGGLVAVTPDAVEGAAEDLGEAYGLLARPSFANQRRAVDLIAPYLVAQAIDSEWDSRVRVLGMMLPPYVRPLLASHPKDNRDLLTQLDVPLLVVHGAKDGSLPAVYVQQVADAVPGAQLVSYDLSGHTPFAEEPERFNRDLKNFVSTVWD